LLAIQAVPDWKKILTELQQSLLLSAEVEQTLQTGKNLGDVEQDIPLPGKTPSAGAEIQKILPADEVVKILPAEAGEILSVGAEQTLAGPGIQKTQRSEEEEETPNVEDAETRTVEAEETLTGG